LSAQYTFCEVNNFQIILHGKPRRITALDYTIAQSHFSTENKRASQNRADILMVKQLFSSIILNKREIGERRNKKQNELLPEKIYENN